MKKWKNMLCFAAAFVLTIGTLAGCGVQKKETSSDNADSALPDASADGSQAKGRYAETDIPLPHEEETPLGIVWENEALTLYTFSNQSEPEYFCYQYENGSWSEPSMVPWMKDAAQRLLLSPAYLYPGQDGKLYAMAFPADESLPYGQYILTSEDGQTALDLTPEDLLEIKDGGYREMVLDLAVLKDGTLCLGLMTGSQIVYYQNGKQVFLTESAPVVSDHQNLFEASKDTLALFSSDGTSVDFYSTGDFQKVHTISTGQELSEALIFPGGDGVWYLTTSNGIQRLTEDGSIIETIMDGSNGLMSSSSISKIQFAAGSQEDFYGLYRDYSSSVYKLKYYSFNKEIPSSPTNTLSIYGLRENSSVSQAVYEFQSSHPDVRVEYNTAAVLEEEPTTDDIRTLNAELLNGSGADVLILDGLPLQSYMEKGILSDLTSLADSLEQEGMLDMVRNTAEKDGKIYALPAKINVPILFGTAREMAALDSLDALHSYVQQYPDQALFGKTAHHYIGVTLFHAMYDELLLPDQSLDQEKLTQLIQDWMQICETSGLSSFESFYGDDFPAWNKLHTSFNTGEFFLGNEFAAVNELNGLGSAMMPYAVIEEKNLALQDLKGYYVPCTIAGINASSDQQELALEFIRTLFMESVQKINTFDGFPVMESALSSLADYVDTDAAQGMCFSAGIKDPETGEDIMISGGYPSRERVEELIAFIQELDTPFLLDPSITNTAYEELERCYSGSQSPEDTAAAICRKVSMYLAE